MNPFRITKYDPRYRVNGVYNRYEWSSIADVGRVFADGLLTQEECSRVVSNYVTCVLELMRAADVPALTLRNLEDPRGCCPHPEGAVLAPEQLAGVIRSCLEEEYWCRLEQEESFVHFGYDLYMYVRVSLPDQTVEAISTCYGLFAEPFRSPYSDEPEGLAFKPLSFSIEAQAGVADSLSKCIEAIEQQHKVTSLAPYTDALDEIGIIPWCLTEKFILPGWKERRYISWINRTADIRLQIDYNTFAHASQEERMQLCRNIVVRSLQVVKERCDKKKLRFDLEGLLKAVFPEENA